jgi:TRAP-type mannitol/chloroaromatic compound transport system permease small subunit
LNFLARAVLDGCTLMRVIGLLDRGIACVLSWAQWLALPVVLLLFLQWPLRDIVSTYSREANDFGQWTFALYVAAAFTAATRAGTHLAVDAIARRYSARTRAALSRLGTAVALLPWGMFVLIAGANLVVPSLRVVERFPDTNNPGYFIIKLALWLLAGLIVAQGIVDLARPADRSRL